MKRHVSGNFSTQLFIFFLSLCFAQETKTQNLKQSPRDRAIQEVGDQFEAMFAARLYQQMHESNQLISPGDGSPFAPSNAEMIYRSMLNDEITKKMSRQRSLGVGNLVEKQLKGEIGIGSSRKNLVKLNKVQQDNQEGSRNGYQENSGR